MNLCEFVIAYNGKKIDFDGVFGAQCVDLFRQYSKDVNGTPHTGSVDGAKDLFLNHEKLLQKDYYKKVGKTSVPKPGDVAVWGQSATNKYGHVAIVLSQLDDCLIVFEQDGFKQDGAKINIRSKDNLLGYLRRK